MDTTNIYTLTDPITKQIRYIGKANNIKQRYKAHLNRARKHQLHKLNWINSLKKQKLKPILEVIDIVPISEWIFWEKYWISQVKAWGFNLINYTEGGDGCTFGNQTSFKKGENTRPIVALTKDGKFVKEFSQSKDGDNFCGKKCVSNAVLRNIKSAGGYLWLYKDEYEKMNCIEINDFIKWACFKTKKVANSGSFKKGKITWTSKNVEEIKEIYHNKQVAQINKEDKIIKIFKSIFDAANEINCDKKAIKKVCLGKYKSTKGFKWKFIN